MAKKDAFEPISIDEADRLVSSLPPLPPRNPRDYKQRDQRGRWKEAGRFTQQFIFSQPTRDAVDWMMARRGYLTRSEVAETAIAALLDAEQGKHPMAISGVARRVLARLVANSGIEPREVVEFAVRYVEQELRAGRLLRIEPRD